MSTDLVDISKFQKGPAAGFGPSRPNDVGAINDMLGTSYPIIGYRGKEWTLRIGGIEHRFKRPDPDNPKQFIPRPSIKLVLLRHPGRKSRSYFGKYEEGSKSPPLCGALDGETPDSGSQRQAAHCSLCPHSAWQMQPNGREGRACQEYVRVAVLVHPDSQAYMFAPGEAVTEPVFLRVPAGSMKALGAVEEYMRGLGYDRTFTYITEVKFKEGVSHPQFEFKATEQITAQGEIDFILTTLDKPDIKRITGETPAGGMRVVQIEPPKEQAPEPMLGFTSVKAVQIEQPAETEKVVPLVPRPQMTIEHQPKTNGFASTASVGTTPPRSFTSTAATPSVPVTDGPPQGGSANSVEPSSTPSVSPVSAASDDLPPADASLDNLISGVIKSLKGNG